MANRGRIPNQDCFCHENRTMEKREVSGIFDTSRVRGDEKAKLENLKVSLLLPQAHFLEDSQGDVVDVHYLSDKQKHEIDFAIVKNDEIDCHVEIKLSNNRIPFSLKYFTKRLKPKGSLQNVLHLDQERHYKYIKLIPIEKALEYLQKP